MAAHFAYSQDQGMRVYDGGPLKCIANTLEQFHKLQRGVAWGVPVTPGAVVIDCPVHSAAWRYGGAAGAGRGYSFCVRVPSIASSPLPLFHQRWFVDLVT